MKAATNIIHDGKEYAVGSTVDIKGDALEELKRTGAVVEDKEFQNLSEADKEAKIADLQRQLIELTGSTSPNPPTPGDAAYQLDRDAAIAKLVGEGKSQSDAEKQVDADIKKAAEATNGK